MDEFYKEVTGNSLEINEFEEPQWDDDGVFNRGSSQRGPVEDSCIMIGTLNPCVDNAYLYGIGTDEPVQKRSLESLKYVYQNKNNKNS